MKFYSPLIFSLLLISCVAAANLPSDQNDKAEDEKHVKVEFSDEAKVLLREASFRAISFLCLKDDVMPEIRNTICKKARANSFIIPPPVPAMCLDCTVADPICWDSCPH